MARDDDGDGVFAASGADGAGGSRLADRARDLCVRTRFAVGNFAQGFPDTPLECGSPDIEGQRDVEGLAVDVPKNARYVRRKPAVGLLERGARELARESFSKAIARIAEGYAAKTSIGRGDEHETE
jgi:hypothetical protein